MILYELCRRSVIELSSGQNLGRVDDICFDENSAVITHIILYGRPRLFGLLGREEDTMIPWADIRQIGQDVLLVHTQPEKRTPRRPCVECENCVKGARGLDRLRIIDVSGKARGAPRRNFRRE